MIADEPLPLRQYGHALTPYDVAPIPALPPGCLSGCGTLRLDEDKPVDKRVTITVTVPRGARR